MEQQQNRRASASRQPQWQAGVAVGGRPVGPAPGRARAQELRGLAQVLGFFKGQLGLGLH
ncbi:MAG: hypothetical protein U5L74_09315 [Ideonella sp.]|nr:hypothetical protein [Ideonella sp.]